MILAFELTWTGGTHAPVNSAMIQILTAACPRQRILLHADAAHLAELARDPCFAACGNVSGVEVTPPEIHRGHTQIVSPSRFRRELAIISRALRKATRDAPKGEQHLIVLLSATSTAIWAASLAARLHSDVAGVHVVLHGNLNDAVGWRTRNPLLRRFDLSETLRQRLPAPVRFVVFERNIAEQLARIAPQAASVTDLIPHPVSLGDLPCDFTAHPALDDPIRVGFVGQGTISKGFDIFLDVAERVSARHPGRVAFHMIGKVQQPLMAAALHAPLAEPPEAEPLSRETFTARLARIHFVMLPFRAGYYDLSASGGLIDAVTWLRPVLATDVPLTRGFAEAYGDIGHIGDNLIEMLDSIVVKADQPRYSKQVCALRAARAQRTPAALAPAYRSAVRAGFPTLHWV